MGETVILQKPFNYLPIVENGQFMFNCLGERERKNINRLVVYLTKMKYWFSYLIIQAATLETNLVQPDNKIWKIF